MKLDAKVQELIDEQRTAQAWLDGSAGSRGALTETELAMLEKMGDGPRRAAAEIRRLRAEVKNNQA